MWKSIITLTAIFAVASPLMAANYDAALRQAMMQTCVAKLTVPAMEELPPQARQAALQPGCNCIVQSYETHVPEAAVAALQQQGKDLLGDETLHRTVPVEAQQACMDVLQEGLTAFVQQKMQQQIQP